MKQVHVTKLIKEVENGKETHLYFVADEKIYNGDFFLFYDEIREAKDLICQPVNQGKVLATTDPTLLQKKFYSELNWNFMALPRISKTFMEEYAKNPVKTVNIDIIDNYVVIENKLTAEDIVIKMGGYYPAIDADGRAVAQWCADNMKFK
jgi:hypothetical protein